MQENYQHELPQHIKRHLQTIIETEQLTETKIIVHEGLPKGENFLGDILRIKVVGKEKTINLIFKCALIGASREALNLLVVYEREIFLYTTVFPEMRRFAEERNIIYPFDFYPKCYGTSLEDREEVIILEDMTGKGYVMHDRKVSLNLGHCKLIMRSYGKLHAMSLALKDQKPNLFKQITDKMRLDVYELFTPELTKMQNQFVFKVIDELSQKLDKDEDSGLLQKLEKFKQFQKEESNVLSPEAVGDYAIIIHGDGWTNNFLFKYKDSKESPENICILDWQLSRISTPAMDLSYFFFICTDKHLRDNHYEELIHIYHESLSNVLEELESDPNIFPYETLQEHLRKFSKYALKVSIGMIYATLMETEEVIDIDDQMSNEVISDAIKNLKSKSKIDKKILDVVKDCYRLGYL